MSSRPGAVRGHRIYQALARSSRRASLPPVRVHFLPSNDDGAAVRVAYSISRKVGGAVVRNRWRRRLRAIVAEASPRLTPGAYLIGVAPQSAELTYSELRDRVIDSMTRASGSPR